MTPCVSHWEHLGCIAPMQTMASFSTATEMTFLFLQSTLTTVSGQGALLYSYGTCANASQKSSNSWILALSLGSLASKSLETTTLVPLTSPSSPTSNPSSVASISKI